MAKCDICKDSFVPGAVATGPKGQGKKPNRRNNHLHCAECWEWVCAMHNSFTFDNSQNRPWSALELLQQERPRSGGRVNQPLTPVTLRKLLGGKVWEECRDGIFQCCTIEQCNILADLAGSTPALIFSKIQGANERLQRWYGWSKRVGWDSK